MLNRFLEGPPGSGDQPPKSKNRTAINCKISQNEDKINKQKAYKNQLTT